MHISTDIPSPETFQTNIQYSLLWCLYLPCQEGDDMGDQGQIRVSLGTVLQTHPQFQQKVTGNTHILPLTLLGGSWTT